MDWDMIMIAHEIIVIATHQTITQCSDSDDNTE